MFNNSTTRILNVCDLEILSSNVQLSSKYCFLTQTKFLPIQPNVKYAQVKKSGALAQDLLIF